MYKCRLVGLLTLCVLFLSAMVLSAEPGKGKHHGTDSNPGNHYGWGDGGNSNGNGHGNGHNKDNNNGGNNGGAEEISTWDMGSEEYDLPSGQPLPGILAVALVGGGVLGGAVYLRRRRGRA